MPDNVNNLEKRLADLLEENRLLRKLQTNAPEEQVVVRHSGLGPTIIINTGDQSHQVSGNSRENKVSVPHDVYLRLKKTTPWFEKGYLYTDESDFDNPNLILDIEDWVASRSEEEIRTSIKEIDSEGTLNHLYFYTEGKTSGKALILRKAVADRIGELFDRELVEDG